ncbi:MAG: hypothetical protein Q8928_10420 [Bacteroidota bacterium]|nr:hypothetical protein [Bacteroidota bacterium]
MELKELQNKLLQLSEADRAQVYEQIFKLVSQYDYDFNTEELQEKFRPKHSRATVNLKKKELFKGYIPEILADS